MLSCFHKKKKKLLKGWTAQFLPPDLHESYGPTQVLGVHGIVTYAWFSMLKKLNFNLIFGFHGPTSRSDPGLRTLQKTSGQGNAWQRKYTRRARVDEGSFLKQTPLTSAFNTLHQLN